MTDVARKELEDLLTLMSNVEQAISNVKDSLNPQSTQGGSSMTGAEKAKAEEEAKIAEKAKAAEAEKTAKAETDEKAKAAAEAAEKAKAEADEKDKAKADEKAKADAEAKEKAEADAAEVAKIAAEAAEKTKADDHAVDKKGKEADATTKKARELLKKTMANALTVDDISEFGFSFSDAEASLATKYSYSDLVKVVARLSLETANFRAEAKKAEAEELGKVRFTELEEAGLSMSSDEKVEAQKSKISEMTDEAYASYKEELTELKAAFSSDSTVKDIVKAKASVGGASVETDTKGESLAEKYKKLK